GVLDDTVLVDPSFVRESIASDDGFVRLHRHSGDLRQKLACGKELFTENRRAEWVTIRTNPHGHHELLQGRVAGAFTDAVNRALRLRHPAPDAGGGIRHRQPQAAGQGAEMGAWLIPWKPMPKVRIRAANLRGTVVPDG